ncbi:radical SAM protein [Enterococcus sp. DIV1298c]|uniref:radical SAM/SPASM domain-containing protein n=1 Tax=Enterococcus sp. DIV1298c TaxID=2815328 RepID=UPI001A90DE3A|nr:radical SAM protein [Enterococcus sp. DIV1298c]MBO0461351.1 radical SAM protein [Enterococcus sp. DIV1298c]
MNLRTATQKKMNLFQILLDDPLEVEKATYTIPETAYLVMTHRCNLKCVYCYAEASSEKEYEDSLSFIEWIDVLNQLKDCGVKNIVFTGGEVGLSKDALKYIDYAKKIGLSIGLITNGTLLRNANDAAFLAERCDSITISLDSIDQVENDKNRGKGCYRLAMRGIQNLLDLKYPNISVNTIITNNNFEKIDETIHFLKKNHINYKLGGFSELGRAKMAEISLTEKERVAIELKEKNETRSPFLKPFSIKESCGLGVGEFAINPVGDIFACKLLETADYKLGNIREKQLSAIFDEENIELIRSQSIDRLSKCTDCSFRYLCGGGCRAHHYYATNDIHGVDDAECTLIKETLKHQMVRSCTNE